MSSSAVQAKEPTKRLRNYQLETIAKLVSLDANSPERIAETCGLPITRINSLLAGNSSKFNDYLEKYQKIVMENHHGATMKMLEMLPQCHEAVEAALGSGDKRLAVDTAFRVYDKAGVGVSVKTAADSPGVGDVNFHITNNSRATTELHQTVNNVGTMLNTLRDHLSQSDDRSHELIGEAALSVPAGRRQVGDGEAMPDIEDAEDVFDLVPLPDPDY